MKAKPCERGESVPDRSAAEEKILLLRARLLCYACGVERITKNAAAVALGRLGGLKGGKARAAKLTPEQRRASARKAARARWAARARKTEKSS